MDKSETLNNQIVSSLEQHDLSEIHITVEKRNRLFHIKASSGKYVVSKKDYDVYSLAEKVISTLHKQIKSYEVRNTDKFRRRKLEDSASKQLQKIKKFIIKPMTQENAIEHMKLLGHKFYIYINTDGLTALLFEKDGEIYSQVAFEHLTLETAIVKVLDENLEYLAFVNEENDIVTIAYKRKNGEVGIIDAEL